MALTILLCQVLCVFLHQSYLVFVDLKGNKFNSLQDGSHCMVIVTHDMWQVS
jgi:hypothetical protein